MPDDYKLPRFLSALKEMGVKKLIEPRLDYVEIGEAEVIFDPDGLIKGVEIKVGELDTLKTVGPHGLFDYNGNQVVLYIDKPLQSEEHLREDPLIHSPKYHLKRCMTLSSMDNSGRYDRYIATNNTSMNYTIIPQDPWTRMHREEDQFEMWVPVCRHCLRSVDYSDSNGSRYSHFYSEEDKDDYVRGFDLHEFFSHWGPFFERSDFERLSRNRITNTGRAGEPDAAAENTAEAERHSSSASDDIEIAEAETGEAFTEGRFGRPREAEDAADPEGGNTRDADAEEEYRAPEPPGGRSEEMERHDSETFICRNPDCKLDLSKNLRLFDKNSGLCLKCKDPTLMSPIQRAEIHMLRRESDNEMPRR